MSKYRMCWRITNLLETKLKKLSSRRGRQSALCGGRFFAEVVLLRGEGGVQYGEKMSGCGTPLQGMAGQFLQDLPLLSPGHLRQCADIPLHRVDAGGIFPRNRRVQAFCYLKNSGFIILHPKKGVLCISKADITKGKTKMEQQLSDVFRTESSVMLHSLFPLSEERLSSLLS